MGRAVKLISTKVINLVSWEHSHHKPIWMYGGGLLRWCHHQPYVPIGLWWNCTDDTGPLSLEEMSFTVMSFTVVALTYRHLFNVEIQNVLHIICAIWIIESHHVNISIKHEKYTSKNSVMPRGHVWMYTVKCAQLFFICFVHDPNTKESHRCPEGKCQIAKLRVLYIFINIKPL